MKVAKETVYLDIDGEPTTDEEAGVELFIAKGQEIKVIHEEKGIKGIEPEAENKSDVPESENKSGRKSKKDE